MFSSATSALDVLVLPYCGLEDNKGHDRPASNLCAPSDNAMDVLLNEVLFFEQLSVGELVDLFAVLFYTCIRNQGVKVSIFDDVETGHSPLLYCRQTWSIHHQD